MTATAAAVKERPVLFSDPMIRAILEGRKTQTRRVVKLDLEDSYPGQVPGYYRVHGLPPDEEGPGHAYLNLQQLAGYCPFGRVGDRLWVREPWQVDAPRDGTWADVEFFGCKGAPLSLIPDGYRRPEHCLYRATWNGQPLLWRPSVQMPRWACRILLEVVSVRVERLQAIQHSEADAIAEGLTVVVDRPGETWDTTYGMDGKQTNRTAWAAFVRVWKELYPEADDILCRPAHPHAWSKDPWVWVMEFRRLEPAVPTRPIRDFGPNEHF